MENCNHTSVYECWLIACVELNSNAIIFLECKKELLKIVVMDENATLKWRNCHSKGATVFPCVQCCHLTNKSNAFGSIGNTFYVGQLIVFRCSVKGENV